MTFVLAFLGSLFALLVVVALVWTYATLSVLPRLARWYEEEMAKNGRAFSSLSSHEVPQPVLVHTCEVHGHCNGCRWVLNHLETVAQVPGFELNDIELEALVRMREYMKAIESLHDGVDDPGYARQVQCPACCARTDDQCWNGIGEMGNQVHASRVSAASLCQKAGKQPPSRGPEAPAS